MQNSVSAAESDAHGSPDDPNTVVVTGLRQYAPKRASTGTKTDADLMDTPVSVQVVTKEMMEEQGINRLSDAMRNISGITLGDNSAWGDNVFIRGFNHGDTTFDEGTRYSTGVAGSFARDLVNVEAVEVLKGPASILYGRGEPGGAINTISKKPQEIAAYSVEQEMGSYSHFRTSLDATGPINASGNLLYRLTAAKENRKSYRDFIDNDRLNIFPTVQWKFSPDSQIALEAHYGAGTERIFDPGVPIINGRTIRSRSFNYSEPGTALNDVKEYFFKMNWSHAFNDNWQIKHFLKYEKTSSLDDFFYVAFGENDLGYGRLDENGDIPRTILYYDYNRAKFWNSSLDLTGKFAARGIKHTILAGLDYYRYRETYAGNCCAVFPALSFENPVYGAPRPPRDPAADFFVDHIPQTGGIYLQDQLELKHGLHILAGARLDWYEDHDVLSGLTTTERSPIVPRLGVLWRPVPELSLYAMAANNYGDNSFARTFDGHQVDPESGETLELGAKTELLNERLIGSIAVYRTTKKHVLVNDLRFPANLGYVVDGGAVQTQGVELDLKGQVTPNWTVLLTYAYTDTRTKANEFDNGETAAGQFFGVARNTGSLFTTYAFDGNLQGFKLGGGAQTVGHRRTYLYQPGYAIFDFFASYDWNLPKYKLTTQLNVTNLFDTYYLPGTDVIPGRPVSAVASVRMEF